MSEFKAIKPVEMTGNVIEKIGSEWMLLAAEHDGKTNMMTASWGGIGFLWNKPVAYTFFRPQRYTYEFVTDSDTLSATFFDESFRDKLKLCGAKSGRDIDKVKECGFTVLHDAATPYFAESSLALILRKMYVQRLDPDCFIDTGLDGQHYPEKDYHYMIISEIINVFEKK